MENNQDNLGFCRYCNQSQIVETVGELSQAERDDIATDSCKCQEAQSARRKKERKEKIKNFINKHFEPEMKILLEYAIKMTEEYDLTDFRIALPDDRVVRVWLDKDAWLHIKIRKDSDEELKV